MLGVQYVDYRNGIFQFDILTIYNFDFVHCIFSGQGTQKWLEATSKDFRPKMEDIERAQTKHNLVPETKMSDEMNNPTPRRVRQSVALQQNKQVKVKLRIGSPVEVFSVSANQWIDGKLTGIKKGLIRVAYGKVKELFHR